MANVLSMAIVQAVIGLIQKGWSQRRIARELGIHRETVGRYARKHATGALTAPCPANSEPDSKPAKVTTGSEGSDISKPAKVTTGSERSRCEPFREIIVGKLGQELEGVRIWQDLRVDHGFEGAYTSVRRFIRKINASQPLAFRRMECLPAEEAQVDFGKGAWTLKNGKKRRPHVLRVVLSHSRKAFSIAVWRQTTENFIRALEKAFVAFGGVPKTVVIDNLKAAVTQADWFDPELNPKILDFARHYGFTFLPTKPYTPRHKGKVENGVDYVQSNALKGRLFESLENQNVYLSEWEVNVADTRIHGTTRKQVRQVFETIERPALMPLPQELFPLYEEGKRKVHRDGHIEIEKSYYSVPPEYLGHELWARWDDRIVRFYSNAKNDFKQITIHARVLPGKFQTKDEHLNDKKISAVERGAEYLLKRAYALSDDAGRWGEELLSERGIEAVRVLQGLLSMSSRYPVDAISRACSHALRVRCFRLRPLRELTKRLVKDEGPRFCQEGPLIRPLSEYASKLKVSFNTQS